LVVEIRRIHLRSKATYGAPRVTAELRRRGWTANHKRVERLMRQNGIVGYRPPAPRPHRARHHHRVRPDLLGRLLNPDKPGVAWGGDNGAASQ
jgi:putative transposase